MLTDISCSETAFSIGRPDTLGADLYHNRRYPMVLGDPLAAGTPPELLEPPHCAIIKYMVDLSRITRAICLHIYLSDLSLERAVEIGGQIERDLERWVESLPPALRPLGDSGQKRPLRAAMEPQYVKKQRLATTVREFAPNPPTFPWLLADVTYPGYHNLRILLFGPLLTKASTVEHACPVEAKTNIAKCLDSARLTIEIIYETYQHQDFFRTWYVPSPARHKFLFPPYPSLPLPFYLPPMLIRCSLSAVGSITQPIPSLQLP